MKLIEYFIKADPKRVIELYKKIYDDDCGTVDIFNKYKNRLLEVADGDDVNGPGNDPADEQIEPPADDIEPVPIFVDDGDDVISPESDAQNERPAEGIERPADSIDRPATVPIFTVVKYKYRKNYNKRDWMLYHYDGPEIEKIASVSPYVKGAQWGSSFLCKTWGRHTKQRSRGAWSSGR